MAMDSFASRCLQASTFTVLISYLPAMCGWLGSELSSTTIGTGLRFIYVNG